MMMLDDREPVHGSRAARSADRQPTAMHSSNHEGPNGMVVRSDGKRSQPTADDRSKTIAFSEGSGARYDRRRRLVSRSGPSDTRRRRGRLRKRSDRWLRAIHIARRPVVRPVMDENRDAAKDIIVIV